MTIPHKIRAVYRNLLKGLLTGNWRTRAPVLTKGFSDGHFYSPIIDTNEALEDETRIWPDNPDILGIDFNEKEQLRWLTKILPKYLSTFDYPSGKPVGASSSTFYSANSQFSGLDALSLSMMLQELRPQRMIEIGSGFSSLLTADINQRHLGGKLEFTCIEPFPRPFLKFEVAGISRVVIDRVQDVPLSIFSSLAPGDFLFIDSSHVAKTGSDVNHIYFQIIPHLAPGVIIHIHDIFFPADYPKSWVIGEGRSWNEQYLTQALLMYSQGFRVLFGCHYIQNRFPKKLTDILGGKVCGGGSLWLEKVL